MSEDRDPSSEEVFRFGSFTVFARRRLLLLNHEPLRLGSRAFELLLALLRRAGDVVPAAELMQVVWGRLTVEEANLRVQVGALRKVLAMDPHGQRMIETVPLKGYSFVSPVSSEFDRAAEPGTLAAQRPALPGTLPGTLTRLVGRESSLKMLLSSLERHRLVTVTGTGGVGKTSLVLAAVQQPLPRSADGVCFVELSAVRDPILVPGAVASALAIAVVGQDPLAGLLATLRGQRMLLVLDTCEHLMEAVVQLVEALLLQLPDLRILATSREALRAEGEQVHRLAGLDLPKPAMSLQEALKTASVDLFVQCVRAGQSWFDPTADKLRWIVTICRTLGGLPLALELAAARVEELGLKGVALRLDAAIDVLARGRRTALSRHQTLIATLDWSYELLPAEEQSLLRAVSVFRGFFDAGAAERVSGDRPDEVRSRLSNLFAKSLVTVDADGEAMLYRLLDTTRNYGLEKLAASGDRDLVSQRHTDFVALALDCAEREWAVQDADLWLGRHGRLIDDVRSALDWCQSSTGDAALGARLTAKSSPLWFALSLMHEYAARIELAMTQSPLEAAVEARLWNMMGHAIWHTRANLAAMNQAFINERKIAQAAGLVDAEFRSYWGQALCALTGGDYRQAKATLAPCAALANASLDPALQRVYQRMSAINLHFHGEHAKARWFSELVLADTAGGGRKADEKGLLFDHAVIARAVLARIQWMEGHADQARVTAAEGVAIALSIGHALSLCFILAKASIPIAHWCGDHRGADDLCGILSTSAEQHSFRMWAAFAASYQLVSRNREVGTSPAVLPGLPDLLLDTIATTDPQLACEATLLRAERGQAGWCTPELLRIRAIRVLRGKEENVGEAEALLLRALNIAREQGALAWELRSATSLAELWQQQNRSDAAFELLGPVHGRFTEGFETNDLMRAAALLRGLKPGADVRRARLRSTSRPERPSTS